MCFLAAYLKFYVAYVFALGIIHCSKPCNVIFPVDHLMPMLVTLIWGMWSFISGGILCVSLWYLLYLVCLECVMFSSETTQRPWLIYFSDCKSKAKGVWFCVWIKPTLLSQIYNSYPLIIRNSPILTYWVFYNWLEITYTKYYKKRYNKKQNKQVMNT